jgi:hypothetical protein
MFTQLIRRPEHMHTKRCLANAIINAVQNYRDNEDVTDHDFALGMQDGLALQHAHEYLQTGTVDCSCNSDGTNPCMGSCCDYGRVDGINTDPEDSVMDVKCEHGFSLLGRCPLGCHETALRLFKAAEDACCGEGVEGCQDKLPHDHEDLHPRETGWTGR